MKNQYFGDISDYFKYDILHALSCRGGLKTCACWMLTPDNKRPDGGKIQYLENPQKWRKYNPELFDALKYYVLDKKSRDILNAERAGIVPHCRVHRDIISDNSGQRAAYFGRLEKIARGCELVFFDQDNGIEVKTKPYGKKNSSKYLYWREIERFYKLGHSLLIFQYFTREKRDRFTKRLAGELIRRIGAPQVFTLHTPCVLFLLAPQARHIRRLRPLLNALSKTWHDKIKLKPLYYTEKTGPLFRLT